MEGRRNLYLHASAVEITIDG